MNKRNTTKTKKVTGNTSQKNGVTKDENNIWTVRGVLLEIRVLAKKAAQAQNLYLGDYLSKIIQEDGVKAIKTSREENRNLPTVAENEKMWEAIQKMQESQNQYAQAIEEKFSKLIENQNKSLLQKIFGGSKKDA